MRREPGVRGQPTVVAHWEVVEEEPARFVTEDLGQLVTAQVGASDVDHLNQHLQPHKAFRSAAHPRLSGL